ncbi:MAG: GTP-binding protein [Saonia sp.]
MKTLPNNVVLRPRFQLQLDEPKETILQSFEKIKRKPFLIKRVDDHVFIKLNAEETHFWSPQLHLEINENEEDEHSSRLYGLFGPNPTLWTFFMFLHFGIATLFIIFGIWGYSNWALNKPYGIQLGVMIFMVFIWLVLYVAGREGKRKGRPQMNSLYLFMEEVLKNHSFSLIG